MSDMEVLHPLDALDNEAWLAIDNFDARRETLLLQCAISRNRLPEDDSYEAEIQGSVESLADAFYHVARTQLFGEGDTDEKVMQLSFLWRNDEAERREQLGKISPLAWVDVFKPPPDDDTLPFRQLIEGVFNENESDLPPLALLEDRYLTILSHDTERFVEYINHLRLRRDVRRQIAVEVAGGVAVAIGVSLLVRGYRQLRSVI